MTAMTELVTTARREGTGELLLTSSLLVLYMSLRGTARALGALEPSVVSASRRARTARPAMKPSDATISSITAAGTGASVVTAITARSLPSLAGRLAPDRGGGDVHAVRAERGADAADHARHVLVAEQHEVAVVHLQVEALAPGLEQVRAVQLAERRADHARAVARRPRR